MLHKGLWSILVPLCCASECLLSIFELVAPKNPQFRVQLHLLSGCWVSQRHRAALCKLYVPPSGCGVSSAPPDTQVQCLVPPGALGLVRKEHVPREPRWGWLLLASLDARGCGPLLVGLQYAVANMRRYLIKQILLENQSESIQKM